MKMLCLPLTNNLTQTYKFGIENCRKMENTQETETKVFYSILQTPDYPLKNLPNGFSFPSQFSTENPPFSSSPIPSFLLQTPLTSDYCPPFSAHCCLSQADYFRKEMAVPEVDKKLLEELEEMGFPLACATRALHHSGNSTIEDAVNWIIDHDNDPDINQMPLVALDIDLDSPEPFNLSEEVKIKAQGLRNRAHKMKKEKEKELERERDKERIRAGKELQEAKQIAEENARKRMIASRQAEKEEERRARERIRQKLESDKAERRSKLGRPLPLPSAVSSSAQPAFRTVLEKSTSVPITAIKKGELLSNCLRSLRRNHKGDDAKVKTAFQTLLIYVRNVMKDPDAEKYRRIRISNPVFQERVGNLTEGVRFLELCGFERTNRDQFLHLRREKVDMETLKSATSALHSALTNPFFGLLSVELD